MAHRPQKRSLDFGGNQSRVTLGLGLGYVRVGLELGYVRVMVRVS